MFTPAVRELVNTVFLKLQGSLTLGGNTSKLGPPAPSLPHRYGR